MNVRYSRVVQAMAVAWFVIVSGWADRRGSRGGGYLAGVARSDPRLLCRWTGLAEELGKRSPQTPLARRSGARLLRADCGAGSRLRGRDQGKENRDCAGVGPRNRPRAMEG